MISEVGNNRVKTPASGQLRPPARVLARRWGAVLGSATLLVIVVVWLASGQPPHRPGVVASTTLAPHNARTRPLVLQAWVARWRLTSPASRAVVVADGSNFLVLGGLTTGDVSTASVERVDPAAGTEALLGQLGVAVHDAGGVFTSGGVLVFGGGSYSTLNTVQSWSAGGSRAVGSLPVARSDLAAVEVAGTAYVLGGFDGSRLVGDILATSDGMAFRTVGRLAQPVRYPAVAVYGGRVWVIGGQLGTAESSSIGGQSSDIQVFDPRSDRCSVVGHLPEPLGHAAAFTLDGQLYVAGGRSGLVPSSRIWRITSTGDALDAGMLPFAVSDTGVGVIGRTAWLLGGERSGPAAPLSTVVGLQVAPLSSHVSTQST